MPVKFVVFQDKGEQNTKISFLRPTSFARLFGSKSVMDVAVKLEKDMQDVLEGISF